jgi:hypothetical protein
MFKQSDEIRDYVFPIASVEMRGDNIALKRVLGTAFLIGTQGFALTAKHVIAGSEPERLIAIFALQSGGWFSYEITAREAHSTEDVALVKLDGTPWKSFFRLSNSVEHASCKYQLWGYPDDATFELVASNQAVVRPDLVYNEGYVRRRFTGELPAIQGTSFFELSEVAGTGASGAPVCKITAPIWEVIGIRVNLSYRQLLMYSAI